MKYLLSTFLLTNAFLTCVLLIGRPHAVHAQHAHSKVRAKATSVYNWDPVKTSWTLLQEIAGTFHQNGSSDSLIWSNYAQDNLVSKEIMLVDTFNRVVTYSLNIPDPVNGNFYESIYGTNCYLNQFDGCGSTSWERKGPGENRQLVSGSKWEPLLSGNEIIGRIYSFWNKSMGSWQPVEKEEWIREAGIVTSIHHSGWDQDTKTWQLNKKSANIQWLDFSVLLFRNVTTQYLAGGQWQNASRYTNERSAEGTYVIQQEMPGPGGWIPSSRNTYKTNEEFSYERYIQEQWLTLESLRKTEHWNYHKRLAFSANGDTTDKHHHEYEYDHWHNAIHYWEFNDHGQGPEYIEYTFENTYNSDNTLAEIRQLVKITDGSFLPYKKIVYSKYEDISRPTGLPETSSGLYTLQVYPNPSSDGIFFFGKEQVPEKVLLYTITGQFLKEVPVTDAALRLDSETKGMYLIRFDSLKGNSALKIVIN